MAKLFEPWRLGPLTLRNRTIRAAAFEGMAPEHRPSERLIAYHRAVAAGGVGMTTVAYAAVERSGLTFAHQLWLRPEISSDLRALTDAVHREGAMASIQIGHAGNMSHRAVTGERPMAPSARFNLFGPTWPRAMSERDIESVTSSFARAVTLAREAGFDAVEVHAGHGYLLSQFLSPSTNRRRDAYGGGVAGRMRFLREVIARVKQAAGTDLAVLVKVNLRDGFLGGLELEESIEVARALEAEGADALVLSGGFVSREPMYLMRGAMPTRVMGGLMPNAMLRYGVGWFGQRLIHAWPYRDNYFLDDALKMREAVKLPLVYIGGATTRAGIDDVLGRGFDAVAMARALIREPDFVSRMQSDPDARSLCDHCNYCAARIYTGAMTCHHLEAPAPQVAQWLARDQASARDAKVIA